MTSKKNDRAAVGEEEIVLSDAQKDIIKTIYKLCDIKSNGKIDRDGLEKGMDLFGTPMDDNSLDQFYDTLDPENKGFIEYNTFVNALKPLFRGINIENEQQLRENLTGILQEKKKKNNLKNFLKIQLHVEL